MLKKSEELFEHPPLQLENCLAKSRKIDANRSIAGQTVFDHCRITGEVARELIARSPEFLRESFFPDGSALIAACHDLGKVSPTFQKKIYSSIENPNHEIIAALSNIDQSINENRGWGGHAGVSQCALEALKAGKLIASIAGCHHGYAPDIGARSADAEVFGGQAWQSQRAQLLKMLTEAMRERFPEIHGPLHARMLAGLTSVADWISSGRAFDAPEVPWRDRIAEVVDAAGFRQQIIKQGMSFREIFGFDAREIQRCLIEVVSRPGIYILEAPMGIGKTEAALFAAYSIVAAGKARGIYFALPTQLTSNRIHSRVNQFLGKVLEGGSGLNNALLVHGSAWLQEFDLGADAAPGYSWFKAAKRGLLAPFAVGTVDQALMASMNVKHGFVRTFGIAGKVVILDEVHTYDAYTGTLLDRLVDELRQLHCTVIILSATLTSERRSALLGSSQGGETPYPLISALRCDEQEPLEIAPQSTVGKRVAIRSTTELDEAVEEALDRAESGQQVLWIENTVAEAQQVYKILTARSDSMDIECGLLHSRFIHIDREVLEETWVTRYGAEGSIMRRERGRILVGTQVLEQSLDIDADFLITRLCPTDMLLQRIGRLWRHDFHHRPTGATCETWIISAEYEAAERDPDKTLGTTAKVYSPYVLLRTLQVWNSIKELSLPDDIRGLLEQTYETRQENQAMAKHKADLQKRKEMLERFALQGVSPALKAKPDVGVSTRYSDFDTVELLLLKSISHHHEKDETTVRLLDGRAIRLPKQFSSDSRKEQRKLAALLATQTLQIAEYAAPAAPGLNTLAWLKPYFYLGDPLHNESRMRIAIVSEGGLLKLPGGGTASGKYELSYHPRLGYHYEKR